MEIVSELEKHAVAIIELQTTSNGGDPRLAREVTAQKVTELFDTLRTKIDAVP